MADQNITALPVAASPASSDQLLLVGATEEKLIDYDKLADAILTKLTSKQYTLDQGTKTLPAALNELNSKRFFTENIGDTTADNHAKIDRNIDFEAMSWINSNYDKTFGNQWCFIKSIRIDQAGYAFQFIISCQLKTTVASRYCDKGTWGKWSIIS